MVAGQVGVVATQDLMGRIIRKVTDSDVNHAVFGIGFGWCVSAEPDGARLRPTSYFPGAVWSRFEYASKGHRRAAINFAMRQAAQHTGYNFADDVALLLVLRFGWHAPKWAVRRLSDPRRLQCAQLSDLALQAGGVHAFTDDRPAGLVTPAAFETLAKARGWWPT